MNANDLSNDDFGAMTEELVAYLDGELDARACREVEKRLSHDADYRLRLQELQQSWDLLDSLPRADVDMSFTQSTVAMIAVTAREDADRRMTKTSRRRGWFGGLVALAALTAFSLGYGVVYFRLNLANRRILRDLPVIESLDEYRYAESLEFLRMLDDSGLFLEDGRVEEGATDHGL